MARSRTPRGFEMVRAIAASLPDVEASTSWNAPSFKLRGDAAESLIPNP